MDKYMELSRGFQFLFALYNGNNNLIQTSGIRWLGPFELFTYNYDYYKDVLGRFQGLFKSWAHRFYYQGY